MQDCGKGQHGTKQLLRESQDNGRSPVLSSVQRGQGTWNVGGGSGYSRDRQASWDAREMRTATTKVRREVYQEFQRLCQEQKTTPYAVLQGFLLAFVDRFGGGGEAPAKVQDKPRFTGWNSSGGGG